MTPATDEFNQEVSIAPLLRAARENIPVIAASLIICIAAALLYILTISPIYTSSAAILLDPYRNQSSLTDGPANDGAIDSAMVDTQSELIRSEAVARLVIQRLGASADHDINPTSRIPVFLSSSISWLRSLIHAGPEEDAPLDPALPLISDLASNLTVRRVAATFVIQLAYQANDPVIAAKLANAIAEAYLDEANIAQVASANLQSAGLGDRATELKNQMMDARRKVQEYSGADIVMRRSLTSLADSAQSTYEIFLRRSMETEGSNDLTSSASRLVSPATIPIDRSWPRAGLILAGALFLGAFIGISIGLLRQRFGRVYRSSGDIEALLGRCIGECRIRQKSSLWRRFNKPSLDVLEIAKTASDRNAGFADVVKRILFNFDLSTQSKPHSSVGILSFGSDISGSVFACGVVAEAAKVGGAQSAMLVEATSSSRLATSRPAQDTSTAGGPPELGEVEETLLPPEATSPVYEIRLEPKAVMDVNPAKVRGFLEAAGKDRSLTVVSFASPSVSAVSAWIAGLDAYIIIINRQKTQRRVVKEVLNVPSSAAKCIGAILA